MVSKELEKKSADEENTLRKYARFAKPELTTHLKNWKGDHYMTEAKKLNTNAAGLTNQIRVSFF